MAAIRRHRKPDAIATVLSGLLALLALSSCVPADATVTTTVTLTVPADPYDLSYLVDLDPAGLDNSGLAVTPLEKMHIIGTPPVVDIDTYRFAVEGLAGKPLSLSYADLKAFPAESRTVLLICPRTFADNPSWTGVPLTTILEAAGARPGAAEVVLHSMDGFEIPLPLELAPDILLAYEVNGVPLPPGHGYPLRAVVKGRIGLYWLRWLKGIEIR
jgi:DMSO/TMAO reductase YedYZ molybdopterin-dependent catalytic subunit